MIPEHDLRCSTSKLSSMRCCDGDISFFVKSKHTLQLKHALASGAWGHRLWQGSDVLPSQGLSVLITHPQKTQTKLTPMHDLRFIVYYVTTNVIKRVLEGYQEVWQCCLRCTTTQLKSCMEDTGLTLSDLRCITPQLMPIERCPGMHSDGELFLCKVRLNCGEALGVLDNG